MKYLLIPIGIVILICAWVSALAADGWNAPEGKLRLGPTCAALFGVGCIVGVFFF